MGRIQRVVIWLKATYVTDCIPCKRLFSITPTFYSLMLPVEIIFKSMLDILFKLMWEN